MAARLVRLDCSRGGVVVLCACGYRSMVGTQPEARRVADTHRRQVHPDAQRRTESKRRTRSGADQ